MNHPLPPSVISRGARSLKPWRLAALFLPVAVFFASTVALSTEATPPPSLAPVPEVATLPGPARLVESSFFSPSLAQTMAFSVYLPAGYEGGSRRYPVLYMLHGLGGSHNDWQRWGLFDVASQLIENGQVPPLIIVAPDGESGYWMDHANGGPR